MLVLSRKPGERILIGDDIVVTVVRFNGGTVRLGIEAPRDFPVIREELSQSMAESNQQDSRASGKPLIIEPLIVEAAAVDNKPSKSTAKKSK